MRRWEAHGLVIGCDDVALDVRRVVEPDNRPVDVVVRVLPASAVPAYGESLPGRTLAHYDDQDGSALSVVEHSTSPGGTVRRVIDVCFHGVALATLDSGAGEAHLRLAPDADPGLAGVIVSGTLLSVWLMLAGHPVLHASGAVVTTEAGPRAIAFVGQSGMGKSTMATLLCRDGATLLTDDVLRTDVAGDVVLAHPGATALRLRAGARELGVAAAGDVATTADERYSASPGLAARRPVRLGALIVPQPDRESDRLNVTRLEGPRAVLALAGFPRILGWTDPATSGAALQHWGALVRRVPVLVMRIPWGPPFAEGLGEQVVEAALAPPG